MTHWRTPHQSAKCQTCDDYRWVCENHPDNPWEGNRACECGGAGAPCPKCNIPDGKNYPASLEGSTLVWDIHRGWVN